ncbi:hypothetical protein Pmani_012604 [Petrolisthes manimaculis]|uniref:MD-2-related lipid-recognition domain-containing protein n=1 Tax=Petrolisthes manimaculis TaxID=1843537 RepID=A0AAE1Q0G6_9EUCA|nr:hypothetical protein Pmani_012604 [Petrolisthes manimaculis]
MDRVEVRECSRWPCLALAGRKGTYQITFTPRTNESINNVKSDIHAWVKLPFLAKNQGPIRVPMPRETNQPLCRYLTSGCPINPGVTTTVKKSVTIPIQARMAQGNVVVEVSIKDDRERILTCFYAPVVVA